MNRKTDLGRKKVKISASILTADFSNLDQEVRLLEKGGVDWLHLDVMDGRFVPNISFGPMVIRSLRKKSNLYFDTHLMIGNPEKYIENFREAGADGISIHYEACKHVNETIKRIRDLGARVGMAINPLTPISRVKRFLSEIDILLIMSVNPGFGGQKFLPFVLEKVKQASSLLKPQFPHLELEVDGGIDQNNVGKVVAAGATVVVAGASIFNGGSPTRSLRMLRREIDSV